jgi:arylsulfatase A-like enzyme
MSDRKPNVVIINIDQLRAFTTGCYGDEIVQTPHIDGLASGGLRFEHGISNNPVCVPARSILLSGQYSRTCTGALGNAAWRVSDKTRRRLRDKTIAEAFREMGYLTGAIGKWHMDPDPHVVGFDYSCLPRGIGHKAALVENGGEIEGRIGFQEDHLIVKARDFVFQHKDRPFFLYYNILPPHMPIFDIPFQYNRMYDRDTVPMRANVWNKEGELAYDREFFHVYLWQNNVRISQDKPITSELPDGFDLRDITALYYGATTWADAIVGEIVKSLQENQLLGDTLIVLTADHGDNLGSHHLFNKDRHYEESIRIPMIFSHPGCVRAGQVNRVQQAQIVDIFPTLIDYCAGEIPSSVQGTSLAPILKGESDTAGDNLAFVETAYHQIAVRTPSHKVAFQTPYSKIEEPIVGDLNEGNIWEVHFYDLDQDPLEQNNLAETHKDDPIFRDLANRLLDWNKTTPWLCGENGKPMEWSLRETTKN